MRDKQDTLDYRFMPEPNLPPLTLITRHENLIDAVGEPNRTALPFGVRDRLLKDGLSAHAATVLLDNPDLLAYYRDTVVELRNQRAKMKTAESGSQAESERELVAGAGFWLASLFLALIRQHSLASAHDAPLRPARFAEFVTLAYGKHACVRYVHAKRILERAFESNESAEQCRVALGIPIQINDEHAIRECVRRTLDAHPDSVDSFRKRAAKKFQRMRILEFFAKTSQQAADDRLNEAELHRVLLDELAQRGCRVQFDDADADLDTKSDSST
jgi:Asp-tRNA(Asn)/Glu-tRNA(Gln) amidotransferase B subunit